MGRFSDMESQKRVRSLHMKRGLEGQVSSEESDEGPQDHSDRGAPRQRGNTKPHTFKACCECRQQKLRCDVVGDPGQTNDPCSRCRKHNLPCKIDSSFKRVKKRGKYEELQREVEELRSKLAGGKAQYAPKTNGQYGIQNELALAKPGHSFPSMQRLEDISLSGERIEHLFNEFFTFYNASLPMLDPQLGIDHYFNASPLLGWTILIIASRRSRYESTLLAALTAPYSKLLWATISTMSQGYHVVKALCLLCTWPLPANNSSVDPNFLLSGILMQIALQNGLHRPAHARDFGRNITTISDAEVKDRTWAWCACNIVVQRANISHPSRSIYDWTLGLNLADGNALELPQDLLLQLSIEKFCDRVSKMLYQNSLDPLGIIPEMEQATTMSVLRTEYRELEASLADKLTASNKFHFLAAGLHLHSFAFFIPRTSAAHSTELLHLHSAATLYIQSVLEHEANTSTFLRYGSSPLQQALIGACCVLLKLLNSSFAIHLDLSQGKTLFNSGILALRSMSINANDLPARTAEGLSRMCRSKEATIPIRQCSWNICSPVMCQKDFSRSIPYKAITDFSLIIGRAAGSGECGLNPVELKIRSRMSWSHVFDCVWSWKEGLGDLTQAPRSTTSQAMRTSSQFGAGDFQPGFDDFQGLSALQDIDLFNTLDWAFVENAVTWPGPQ